jgi:hypothetical protein
MRNQLFTNATVNVYTPGCFDCMKNLRELTRPVLVGNILTNVRAEGRGREIQGVVRSVLGATR